MSAVPSVLQAVAKELASMAKNSLPELRTGERIRREWYENGVFYRETDLDGAIFVSLFDCRQRKSCRLAAEGRCICDD